MYTLHDLYLGTGPFATYHGTCSQIFWLHMCLLPIRNNPHPPLSEAQPDERKRKGGDSDDDGARGLARSGEKSNYLGGLVHYGKRCYDPIFTTPSISGFKVKVNHAIST